MTPQNTPSAFHTYRRINPNPENPDNLGIPPGDVSLDLKIAITYANANEMARLVDKAISSGANVNYFDFYENNLLVVAVRSNQAHAIAILMARGMDGPYVPAHGVDVLMEAAAAGHEELIEPLLTRAGMDVYAVDAYGKTALHHAVIGGSKKIVEMFLKRSAYPNVFTTHMDDAELQKLFGDNHTLTGASITPLMIASAFGNFEIVALLLKANAAPAVGECLPLALACKKGHAPTIKLLLEHQTRPKFMTEEEHAMLSISLESRASLECLRLIAAHHCFDKDDGTVNSPLGAAIKTKQPSVVALLLACGAPIEKFVAEKNTLWDEAFANEKKLWELLDLLVTKSPLKINSPPDYLNQNFLINFFDHCHHPITLAVLGFYPSVVASAQEELKLFQTEISSCTKMEKQLSTALFLKSNLQKIADDSFVVTYDTENNTPDNQWLNATSINKKKQKQQLVEETNLFINAQFTKLKHVLTLEFFIACTNSCPQNRSLKSFILNKLAIEMGAPNKVCKAIAEIWSQAAQWTVDWHMAPNAIDDANRFLFNLSRNLFNQKFTLPEPDDLSIHSLFQTLITTELSEVSSPLSCFCTNPVAWLRKFEQRSNLRRVNIHDLTNSLQVELGLPIATCQAISNAWSVTINLARKSAQWKTTAELDRLLAIALAPLIENCLSDEFAQRIIPDLYIQNLLHWVERVKNQPIHVAATNVGRKRPSSEEPDGAPLRKQPRL